MKKSFLLLALIIIAGFGFSQNNDQELKATSGITTDVNFSPFNSNDQAIGLESINVRWFIQPKLALRLGVQANYFSDKYDNEETGFNNLVAGSSTFLFGFLPGIEYHFEGTNRLSPYVGAEIYFFNFSAQAHAESDGDEFYTINGATDGGDGGFENRAYNEFGLSANAGFDYYFSKNIYVGAEFGYGFSYFQYNKVEETVDGITTEISSGKLSAKEMGTNTRATLKLGWKF